MIIKMMKDIVDEYHGVDIEQKHREEKEERQRAEKEYKENNFAPVWAKRSALVIAIFYILIAGLMMYEYFGKGNVLAGIGTIALLISAIAGAVMMNLKDKKKQMYGCVIFCIFLAVQSAKSFILTK